MKLTDAVIKNINHQDKDQFFSMQGTEGLTLIVYKYPSTSNIWFDLSKKYNIPIKIMGRNAIPSFEFYNNHVKNKTFLTQEMLKNKILATNTIFVNIFHNKNNIKRYINVLDKIFNDLSRKDIKKILKSKECFKPINRIN